MSEWSKTNISLKPDEDVFLYYKKCDILNRIERPDDFNLLHKVYKLK